MRGGVGCARERVRKGLVLGLGRSGGVGHREVRAFEVGGGEGGDVVPDGGRELGDGLLDLGWVVIAL